MRRWIATTTVPMLMLGPAACISHPPACQGALTPINQTVAKPLTPEVGSAPPLGKKHEQ
jgi:hypothetical protein